VDAETHAHLVLMTTRGLGPVLIARALARFGTAQDVLDAPATMLQELPRMPKDITARLRDARPKADEQIQAIQRHGVHIVRRDQRDHYPSLLDEIPDPPPLLFVRGRIDPGLDRYPVAIVGSRRCSTSGMEQATRFAGHLASSGLTVVSGGARGIDARAHHAALRHGGRTIAVMGCGLDHIYPPEHADLYEQIADGNGAVISEFPMGTGPSPELFPRRNRIISGLSMGVLVIEAGLKSGALITARQAIDDHGRDAMALPGPVDRTECAGSNHLLKMNEAAMVTEPNDVLDLLRERARFVHADTHAARYADPTQIPQSDTAQSSTPEHTREEQAPLPHTAGAGDTTRISTPNLGSIPGGTTNEDQEAIMSSLEENRSIDFLIEDTGLPAALVQRELTKLELRGLIRRKGPLIERRAT
jgi:DNA processing protein